MGHFPKQAIHLHHVAGHADIPGNDKADGLAKEGALHSERESVNLDLINIVNTYGFNHLLIREELFGDIT